MKRKKRALPSSSAMTALLLSFSMLLLWGVSMACVTNVTAEYAASRMLTDYSEFASVLARRNYDESVGEGNTPGENLLARRQWGAVLDGGRAESFLSGTAWADGEDGFLLPLAANDTVSSAAAVFDAEGNLLAYSWEDFFVFAWQTEEEWKSGEDVPSRFARARFDRACLTEAGAELEDGLALPFFAEAMRFTGTFDGMDFTPSVIEYVSDEDFSRALSDMGSGSFTVSGVVEEYELPWRLLYENPGAVPSVAEQVVFYSDRIDLCLARPSPSFSYDGKQYEELKDFICELGPVLIRSSGVRSRFEGTDLLIPSASYCIRSDGVTWPESNWFHPETSDGQELLFCTVSVVVGSPWRMAMSQLKSVYLGSFLLAAALALLLWTLLRRRLIVPARLVAEELAKDERTGWSAPPRRVWREGQRLFEGLARVRGVLQEDAGELGRQKNEITRLNTVLQYAEDAEANRRQLTSSIAHELKTPLAVVHSYAEGLKERIAEKKRDQYLDVILSETERMDAMVLEMLDLSRLEAGRVKLSRDEFSLPALTRAVFDKLERAIEAKELRLTLNLPRELTVTADESRIAQVIENFASNAVKYTPAGGCVEATLGRERGGITFTVTNDSAPLSEEALRRVWDTFYRADESRSGGGTGLGFAIARNIIELHGGRCFAYNTEKGVAFGFTI